MNRIKILDGFRCLAIIMVLLDHYTSTFTKEATRIIYPYHAMSLYPFGDKYSIFFKDGYLGVQLFFMISGFVIYMTLEKTDSFIKFMSKRFFRLFPLLLICSIITFFLPALLDSSHNYPLFHRPYFNFFPSLTFTDLWIWNIVFKTKSVEYIDNAYWTLGLEMKFYLFASILYFASKRNFFRNWLIFNLSILVGYCITLVLFQSINNSFVINFKKIFEVIFFVRYIFYFTLGAYFYRLYTNMSLKNYEKYEIMLLALISCSFLPIAEIIAMLLFSGLFYLFVYKPRYLSFLSSKPVVFIGLVSYPLYLIHQNVGLLLMNKVANHFKIVYSELLVIPTIVFFIGIAYLLHRFIEMPGNKLSKNLFNNSIKREQRG
jgi:peptidoglycan/LPS O-acetylase OafA/YrhL